MSFLPLCAIAVLIYAQNNEAMASEYTTEKRVTHRSFGADLIALGSTNEIESDSTRRESKLVANLRSQLKYKFVLDFLEKNQPERLILGERLIEKWGKDEESFRLLPKRDSNEIEAFRYFLPYHLYPVKTFDGEGPYYLLSLSSLGHAEYFLLSERETGALLDSLEFSFKADPKMEFFELNHHNFIRINQSLWGSGARTNREDIVGIVSGRFVNFFTIFLLDANDWTMAPEDRGDHFTRKTRLAHYLDLNEDGFLDIKVEGSEDVILMQDDSWEFQKGKVIKHIRSWMEVYLWDEKTSTFNLDKKRSTMEE